MKRIKIGLPLVAALGLSFAAAPAGAQTHSPSVTGMGYATVEHQAERMRMWLEISVTAPTLKEALATLKDRREAAQTQLEALGADKSSIKFGDVSRKDDSSDRRRQMERMVRMRAARRPGKEKAVAPPAAQTVSLSVTADWPLTKGAPEQVLLAVNEIQTKVEAADLAGLKEKKPLSPEEQEIADEVSNMSSSDEESQGSKPRFAFVAKVTDDERDKALADAFAKAKAQASRTAKAAGVNLGGLLRLADQTQNYGGEGIGMNSPFDESPNYAYQMRMRMAALGGAADEKGEVLAPQLGAIPLRVTVMADFEIK